MHQNNALEQYNLLSFNFSRDWQHLLWFIELKTFHNYDHFKFDLSIYKYLQNNTQRNKIQQFSLKPNT